MILVTHDLGVIAGPADRTAVMYAGRIVETGTTPRQLRGTPRHPYTEALFEALPERAAVVAARGSGVVGGAGRATALQHSWATAGPTSPPHGCKFAARCRYVREECRETEPR